MINLKLFAHIFNDPYLKGTENLEGEDFRNTVGFLMEYIKFKIPNFTEANIDEFDGSLKTLYKLAVKLNKLQEFLNKSLLNLSEPETLADYIIKEINKLTPEEDNSVLLPGGWINLENNTYKGHALIYEFKKNQEGQLIFLIHNTGAGLEFHKQIPTIDKERFCSIKSYLIPKEFDQERLKHFIIELLKPQLLEKRKNYDAKILYQNIFPLIAYLNGKEIDPIEYGYLTTENATAGQFSGTCAEKVVKQMSESQFPDKQSYKKFIYDFKKFALEQYIKEIDQAPDLINQTGVRNQVSLAIESMARSLMKSDYFSTEEQDKELEFLKLYQQKFSRISAINLKDLTEEQLQLELNLIDSVSAPIELNIEPMTEIQTFRKTTTTIDANLTKDLVSINIDTTEYRTELQKFLSSIKELHQQDLRATLFSLEEFFINCPLTFFNNQTYQILEELNQIYVAVYKKLNPDRTTPNFIINQLNFIMMLSKGTSDLSDKFSYFNLIAVILNDLIIKNEAFLEFNLTPTDARYANKLNQIFDDLYSSVKILNLSEIGRLTYSSTDIEKISQKYFITIIKKYKLFDLLFKYFNSDKFKKSSRKTTDTDDQDVIQEAQVIEVLQQYFDAPAKVKDKILNDLLEVNNILSEDKFKEIKELFENITKDLYERHQKIDLIIAKVWSSISEVSPNTIGSSISDKKSSTDDNHSLTMLKNSSIYKLEINAIHFANFSKDSTLKKPDLVKWEKNSILKELLDNLYLHRKHQDATNLLQIANFLSRKFNKTLKSKNILLYRELMHLRTSSFQIPATIDFFSNKLHYLEDHSMQIYLEYNLFHPIYLTTTCLNDSDLTNNIYAFLELGIQTFTNQKIPNLTGIYFMKLKLKLALWENDLKSKNSLDTISCLETIENLLYIYSNPAENKNNFEAKAALHFQRILLMDYFLKTDPKKNFQLNLSKLVSSLFLREYYYKPQLPEDLQRKDQIKKILYLMETYLNSSSIENKEDFLKDTFTNILTEMFGINKIDLASMGWNINLPLIKINDNYIINLTNGIISTPGLVKRNLPDTICNTLIYKKIFGSFIPICMGTIDDSAFEFKYNDREYKILLNKDHSYSIYSKINPLGKGYSWHEAKDIQQIKELTAIFREKDNVAWIDPDGNILMESSIKQDPFYYQADVSKLFKLNAEFANINQEVLPINSFLYKIVENFEDPNFVICLKTTDGYIIELPRYSLNLTVKKTGDTWQVFLDGTDLVLDLNATNEIIPGFNAILYFTNGVEKFAIIPKQPFFVETKEESHELAPSTSLIFSQKLHSKTAVPYNENEYYDLIIDLKNHLDKNKDGIYRSSQTYTKLIIETQEFIPQSMNDGLYLCYIYLCNHQPQKAFNLLSNLGSRFGQLSGSKEELNFIEWITLPDRAHLEENSPISQIMTPEFLAIKLKALSLLARYYITNPDPSEEAKLIAKIITFYKTYQSIINNVPKSLQLMEEDSLILLRAIFQGKKTSSNTAILEVEWRKLEISNIQSRLSYLSEALRSDNEHDEDDAHKELTNRLDKTKIISIDTKVKGTINITVTCNSGSIDLTEEENQTSLSKDYIDVHNLMIDNLNKNKPLDLKKLTTFPTDVKYFASFFPVICKKIYNNEIEDDQLQALKEFCRETIIAYANFQVQSNLKEMCSCLYKFIIHLNRFKEIESQEEKKETAKSSYKKFTSYLDFTPKSSYSSYDNQITFESIKEWCTTFMKIVDVRLPKETINTPGLVDQRIELIDTQELTKTINTSQQKLEKIDTNLILDKDFLATQLTTKYKPLNEFYQSWSDNIEKHDLELKKLKEKLQNTLQEKSFTTKNNQQALIDKEAGSKIYAYEQQQLQLAIKYLGNPKALNNILEISKENKKVLEEQLQGLLLKILHLANKNKTDLGSLGQRFNQLQFTDLLRLYLQENLNEYIYATNLNQDECIVLHNTITSYLSKSTDLQHFNRLSDKIEEHLHLNSLEPNQVITINSSLEQQKSINAIANILTEKNLVDYSNSPDLAIFQYNQKILIRKEQLESINQLSEKENIIIQLIMGGGKSKVLLPILAFKRSTGNNLSIIEVPKELYTSNLADLSRVAMELFGQRANGFIFDRNSPSEAHDFKRIFRHFEHIIATKGFLVTTPESMTSLELKYYELLRENKPKKHKQIKWLDRILKLKKDILADEVDTILDPKRESNYTIGDEILVSEQDIKACCELFKFIIEIGKINEILSPDLISASKLSSIFEKLAEELVNSPNSPIAFCLTKEISTEERQEIIKYLLNKSTDFPTKIFDKIKSAESLYKLKLYKGQINNLLPHTLKLRLFENYGPSKDPNKNLATRAIAIPYAGNNEPREKSKDKNHFKTLNLTIQSNLISGISEDLMEEMFNFWNEQAKSEFLEEHKFKNLTSINDTHIAKKISRLLKLSGVDLKFEQINFNLLEHKQELLEKLSKNHEFIFFVLETEILPKLQINNLVVTQDAQNHVSTNHSFQGITGTPWNSFATSLVFDKTISLGTDGLIITRLEEKDTQIYAKDCDNLEDFFNEFLKLIPVLEQDKIKAIVDVGATFCGIDNKKVAQSLANYIRSFNRETNPLKELKYILYFEENELVALPITSPDSIPISLKGKSFHEINNLLHCTPKERFTYYDQKHAFGSDIKQTTDAIAIVTISNSTLIKDLTQGVARLRDLAGNQKIVIAVSTQTAQTIKSLEDLTNSTQQNQNNRLLSDNFTSTLQKMANVIRTYVRQKILQTPSTNIASKAEIFKAFENYFVKQSSNILVENYGMIEKPEITQEIFQKHITTLLTDLEKSIIATKINLSEIEKHAIIEQLNNLMQEGLLNCNDKYLQSNQNQQLDQYTETQTQQQLETHNQMEHEKEMEVQVEYSSSKVNPSMITNWTKTMTMDSLLDFKQLERYEANYDRRALCLLDDIFESNFQESVNVKLTTNANWGRENIIYQKQVHMVLNIQNDNEIKMILITYPEADDIKNILLNSNLEMGDNKYIWLSNSNAEFYYGKMPEKPLLHPKYINLIEQLKFFSGDFKIYKETDLTTSWLLDNYKYKLEYIKDNVLPYRFYIPYKFNKLQNSLNSFSKAIKSIMEATDLKYFNDFSWEKEYPTLNSQTIESIKEFVNWMHNFNAQNNIHGIMNNRKFFTPFFFKLFLDESLHNKLNKLDYYLESIDLNFLENNLINYFASLKTMNNWGSNINFLFSNQIFTQDLEKRKLFLEVLQVNIENHSNIQPILDSNILSNLTTEEKVNLFEKAGKDWISYIFNKLDTDEIVKLFKGITQDDFQKIPSPSTLKNEFSNHYLEKICFMLEQVDFSNDFLARTLIEDDNKFKNFLYLIKEYDDPADDNKFGAIKANQVDFQVLERLFKACNKKLSTEQEINIWKTVFDRPSYNRTAFIERQPEGVFKCLRENLFPESLIMMIDRNSNIIKDILSYMNNNQEFSKQFILTLKESLHTKESTDAKRIYESFVRAQIGDYFSNSVGEVMFMSELKQIVTPDELIDFFAILVKSKNEDNRKQFIENLAQSNPEIPDLQNKLESKIENSLKFKPF